MVYFYSIEKKETYLLDFIEIFESKENISLYYDNKEFFNSLLNDIVKSKNDMCDKFNITEILNDQLIVSILETINNFDDLFNDNDWVPVDHRR